MLRHWLLPCRAYCPGYSTMTTSRLWCSPMTSYSKIGWRTGQFVTVSSPSSPRGSPSRRPLTMSNCADRLCSTILTYSSPYRIGQGPSEEVYYSYQIFTPTNTDIKVLCHAYMCMVTIYRVHLRTSVFTNAYFPYGTYS